MNDFRDIQRIVEPHIDTLQADKFTTRARMSGLKR